MVRDINREAASMYAVINHLPVRPDADWSAIAAKFAAFADSTGKAYPKLKTAVLTRVSDTEMIFSGVYEDRATAEHVSANVAAPWFAENIRQYLAGPANRSAGEVIAGFVRG
jgi:hypothetical protein